MLFCLTKYNLFINFIRFKKKNRSRSEKDAEPRSNYATMRYSRRRGDDYFDFDENFSQPQPRTIDGYFPPSEDEPTNSRMQETLERQYFNKRDQFFKNLTPRSENRSLSESIGKMDYSYEKDPQNRKKLSPRETGPYNNFNRDKKFASYDEGPKATVKHVRMEFEEFDDYENTPQSTSSSKFNYDEEQGFESDFNSPPTLGKSGFRFSNDFSDKESISHRPAPAIPTNVSNQQQNSRKTYQSNHFEADFSSSTSTTVAAAPTTNQTKLRFDDNVTVSNFSSQMFEDDFSKTDFDFEDEDKWSELPKKSIKTSKPCDNIKKSESVNIFAKKVDDPFEDDEFFKSNEKCIDDNNDKNGKRDPFQWEKNFAKFDD